MKKALMFLSLMFWAALAMARNTIITPGSSGSGLPSVVVTATFAGNTWNGTQSTGTLTVLHFANLGGATVSINGNTLTEGVDWHATVSNPTTALSLQTAINTLAGSAFVTGVSSNVVSVSADFNHVGTSFNNVPIISSDQTDLAGTVMNGGVDQVPTTTSIYTPSTTGLYRISLYGRITDTGCAFSTNPTLAWNDGNQQSSVNAPGGTTNISSDGVSSFQPLYSTLFAYLASGHALSMTHIFAPADNNFCGTSIFTSTVEKMQ